MKKPLFKFNEILALAYPAYISNEAITEKQFNEIRDVSLKVGEHVAHSHSELYMVLPILATLAKLKVPALKSMSTATAYKSTVTTVNEWYLDTTGILYVRTMYNHSVKEDIISKINLLTSEISHVAFNELTAVPYEILSNRAYDFDYRSKSVDPGYFSLMHHRWVRGAWSNLSISTLEAMNRKIITSRKVTGISSKGTVQLPVFNDLKDSLVVLNKLSVDNDAPFDRMLRDLRNYQLS